MNKPRIIIAITAGLLASTAANAGDTNLSQLLSASAVTLPAATESTSALHPATEAAISRQIASIDARMTAALVTPSVDSVPAAAATELASR